VNRRLLLCLRYQVLLVPLLHRPQCLRYTTVKIEPHREHETMALSRASGVLVELHTEVCNLLPCPSSPRTQLMATAANCFSENQTHEKTYTVGVQLRAICDSVQALWRADVFAEPREMHPNVRNLK